MLPWLAMSSSGGTLAVAAPLIAALPAVGISDWYVLSWNDKPLEVQKA